MGQQTFWVYPMYIVRYNVDNVARQYFPILANKFPYRESYEQLKTLIG